MIIQNDGRGIGWWILYAGFETGDDGIELIHQSCQSNVCDMAYCIDEGATRELVVTHRGENVSNKGKPHPVFPSNGDSTKSKVRFVIR